MSEIIDFIIELLAVLSGRGRNFRDEYNACETIANDDCLDIVLRVKKHLAKDPSTANAVPDFIIASRKNGRIKTVILDGNYNRITSVWLKDTLASHWKKGKINVSNNEVQH